MKNNDRQNQLNDLLVDLSSTMIEESSIAEVAKRLSEIYSGDFRHSYSQIFATIEKRILNNDDSSLEFLTANLDFIYDYLLNQCINPTAKSRNAKHNDVFLSKFTKLYDHVMLEVARIGYLNNVTSQYKTINTALSNLDKNFNEKLLKQNNELKEASNIIKDEMQSSINVAKHKMDSMRAESITVLSVFAAIMIASWAGTSFFSDILKSINSASIYRIIAVSSVSGFVLFNTVFLLVYMAARVMERSIYTFCLTAKEGEDCSLKEHKCQHNCSGINRIKKRLPYVFWVNMVLALLFFGDIAIYFLIKYGWLEGVYKLLVSTWSIIGIFILVICVVYTLINVLSYMFRGR